MFTIWNSHHCSHGPCTTAATRSAAAFLADVVGSGPCRASIAIALLEAEDASLPGSLEVSKHRGYPKREVSILRLILDDLELL